MANTYTPFHCCICPTRFLEGRVHWKMPGVFQTVCQNFSNTLRLCSCRMFDCPQTRDMTRKTDQSMVEAAKCMFLKMVEEANDDLGRAIPQPQEDHRVHATGKRNRCCRTKTSSGSPCPPLEAATRIPCSHLDTENEVLHSSSKTISPSHGPLKHVAEGDFHK